MPGGVVALVAMAIAGQVSRFVQPRYLMAGALAGISLATLHFTNLSPDADFRWFALARVAQMAAIPVLFLTITSFSYVGLPEGKSGQAAALINVARNLGGSIGVSAAQTMLARREQFHQSRLAENFYSSSLAYNETLKQASSFLRHGGTAAVEAQRQAIGWIGQALINQAAYLSYIDVFAALAIFAAALIPVAFLLQKIDLRAAPAGH
jgi:DHA2 family multidrug resistance protein